MIFDIISWHAFVWLFQIWHDFLLVPFKVSWGSHCISLDISGSFSHNSSMDMAVLSTGLSLNCLYPKEETFHSLLCWPKARAPRALQGLGSGTVFLGARFIVFQSFSRALFWCPQLCFPGTKLHFFGSSCCLSCIPHWETLDLPHHLLGGSSAWVLFKGFHSLSPKQNADKKLRCRKCK